MTDTEATIAELLAGRAPDIPIKKYDICRKPADNSKPTILGYNAIIIVAAVIVDDDGRFILIQEAKDSCRGKWYLPAGRMEKNETLEMGVKREVKEEAGFDFQPTSIVKVESSLLAGYWIRFTFTGKIIGGSIKTEREADKESLQAKWCTMNDLACMKLRARDILPIIEQTRMYHQNSPSDRHPALMPTLNPHKHMSMRVIMVKQTGNSYNVLLCTEESPHFPIIKDGWQAADSLHRLETEAFTSKGKYSAQSIVCVEHLGQPHGAADGVCLTLLVMTDTDHEISNAGYIWHPIASSDLRKRIVGRTRPGMSVPCP